jgi:hypothetical protein
VTLMLLWALACDKSTESGPPSTETGGGTCDATHEACAAGVADCDGESGQMLPGSNCLACHSEGAMPEEDEPELWWTAGGTVFADLDGSAAADGVTVRITGADGAVVELTSNDVGNFWTREALVFPISAEVEKDGAVLAMVATQMTGACGSCHACDGSAGGKLFAP